jgi:hypothetical protein
VVSSKAHIQSKTGLATIVRVVPQVGADLEEHRLAHLLPVSLHLESRHQVNPLLECLLRASRPMAHHRKVFLLLPSAE